MNIYSNNFSGENAYFVNLQYVNVTGINVNITGTIASYITVTVLTGGTEFITQSTINNLTATGIVFSTITGTNINTTNLNVTNTITGSNSFLTNLTVTNFTGLNISFTGANFNNLTAINILNTNFTGTNLSATNTFIPTLTGTNSFFTSSNINNLTATGIVFGVMTGKTINAINGNFNNVNLTGATVNNLITNFLEVANVITGNTEFIQVSNINSLTSTGINVNILTGNQEFIQTSNINSLIATGINVNILTGGTAFITNISGSNITSANILNTNFTGTNLSSTNILNTTLTGINAFITNISGSNTTSANILSTVITGTNGFFTNLTVSNFTGANISFTGANFTNLTATNILNTTLTGTIAFIGTISGSNTTSANILNTNFTGTNNSSTNILTTTLTGINAFITNISGTNTTSANILNTNFTGTNLSATNILNTTLTGINTFITNISGFNITSANILNTNFTGTNNSSTNILTTTLTGTNAFITNLTANSLTITGGNFTNLDSVNLKVSNVITGNIVYGALNTLDDSNGSMIVKNVLSLNSQVADNTILLYSGSNITMSYGFGINSSQIVYSIPSAISTSHSFYAGGHNGSLLFNIASNGQTTTASGTVLDDGTGNMTIANGKLLTTTNENAININTTNLTVTNFTGGNMTVTGGNFFNTTTTNLTVTTETGTNGSFTNLRAVNVMTGNQILLQQSGNQNTFNSNQFYQTPGSNLVLGSSVQLTGSNNNIAIGPLTLSNLSQSQGNSNTQNIAIGGQALQVFITGSNNISIGKSSMQNLGQGTNNTAVGNGSMFGISQLNASSNTFFGNQAGFNMSGSNLCNNNVGVGNGAGINLTTGNSNTFIGNNASNLLGIGTVNSIALGNNSVVGQSNVVVIGNNAITNILGGTGSTCDLGIIYQPFNNIFGNDGFITNLSVTNFTGNNIGFTGANFTNLNATNLTVSNVMTGNIMFSAHNTLDNGSGQMIITATGNPVNGALVVNGNNGSEIVQTNNSFNNGSFTTYSLNGNKGGSYGYATGSGIIISDNVNNGGWLKQGGTVLGSVLTNNNTLDDGKGNSTVLNTLTVNGVGNNLTDTSIILNGTGTNGTFLQIQSNSSNKCVYGWGSNNHGIEIFDQVNNNFWLQQNGTGSGNIQTLNNTLDDGKGNMIVSGQHEIIGLSTPDLASSGSNLYIRSTGSAGTTNSMVRCDVVGGGGGASIDLDFLTYINLTGTNISSRISVIDDSFGNDFKFISRIQGNDANALQTNFSILANRTVSTANNTLDNGSGQMTINITGGGNTPLILNNNSASATAVFANFEVGGSQKFNIGWTTTQGIEIFDEVNSANWLFQNGTTKGNVQTLNNTLDDGKGNMTITTTGSATPVVINVPPGDSLNVLTLQQPASAVSNNLAIRFNPNGDSKSSWSFGTDFAHNTSDDFWFSQSNIGPVLHLSYNVLTSTGVNGAVSTLHNLLDDGSGKMNVINTLSMNSQLADNTLLMYSGGSPNFDYGFGIQSGQLVYSCPGVPNGASHHFYGGGHTGTSLFTIANTKAITTANNTLDDGSGNMIITPNNENGLQINYTGSDYIAINFQINSNQQIGKFGFSNTQGIGYFVQNWTGLNILSQPGDHSNGLKTFNNTLDDGSGNMNVIGTLNLSNQFAQNDTSILLGNNGNTAINYGLGISANNLIYTIPVPSLGLTNHSFYAGGHTGTLLFNIQSNGQITTENTTLDNGNGGQVQKLVTISTHGTTLSAPFASVYSLTNTGIILPATSTVGNGVMFILMNSTNPVSNIVITTTGLDRFAPTGSNVITLIPQGALQLITGPLSGTGSGINWFILAHNTT
jgi:uncharacterized protein YjbI with pentapeptide repeats